MVFGLKVLAVLRAWSLETLLEMGTKWRASEELSSELNLFDDSGYACGLSATASVGLAKKASGKQAMWIQICQPWLHASRKDVAVLQREPGWTDREEDFDSYWGKKNLCDRPKQGWGFSVTLDVYKQAWANLFGFVVTYAATILEAPPCTPLATLKKMKVSELRALCEENKLVKPTEKRVLKEDLIALLRLI